MSLRKKLRMDNQCYKERGKSLDKDELKRNSVLENGGISDMNQQNENYEKGEHGQKEGGYNKEIVSIDIERDKVDLSTSLAPEMVGEMEFKTDFPEIEVIKIEDESEEEEVVLCQNENSGFSNTFNSENDFSKELNCNHNLENERWLSRSQNRDIFPNITNENYKIYELPHLQCCILEHDYFTIRNPDQFPLNINGKIWSNSLISQRHGTTLTFGNRMGVTENRTEQQTIAQKDSITKHIISNSQISSSNKNSSIENSKKSTVDRSNRNSASSGVENIEANQKSSSSRYSLRSSSRFKNLSADGNNTGVDQTREGKSPVTRFSTATGADKSCRRTEPITGDSVETNRSQNQKTADHSISNSEVVSLDDIAKELSEMEKLIQSKCDTLGDKTELQENSEVKNSDILPPKLRKIGSKDNGTDGKEGEFILPMPHLTKMVPENKNWNMEYTEDDVKNLGLDDLLLRASELNAENFTKALGQNSGRNGGKADSSEIVLTFPNSRRGPDDLNNREGDNAKTVNAKKAKLDFCKKYVKNDKYGKAKVEEPQTTVPEVSPKRPGIKVKTVQNINEEFKDSLGGKLKNFEGREITPESALISKPLYTISDDVHKEITNKEIFIPDGRDSMPANPPSVLGCMTNKMNSDQDQTKSLVDNVQEATPFIMTIIQNNDSSINEHIPRVLTSPKHYTRPKPIVQNGFIPLEDLRKETINNKKTDCNAGDNVTLLVSKPLTSRSFEIVNVDEFIPETTSHQPKKPPGLNYVVHYRNGPVTKNKEDGKVIQHTPSETSSVLCKTKNIPFILSSAKKHLVTSNSEKTAVTALEDTNKRITCASRPPISRVVKCTSEVATNIQVEKPMEKNAFTVTSIEQKIAPKEGAVKVLKQIQMEPEPKVSEEPRAEEQTKASREVVDNQQTVQVKQQVISLLSFSNILKDILPEKWVLSLDTRYGLQIIKTHLDELLNPSIMISVVVGRSGKVTVNVRGRQLEKSHDLFSNLCDVGNSNEKISINYILAIINKLRFFNVCFGCDDLSLKKYWCEDGFIEYYTEFQQTYRSHICESLVRLGKKRCYPCYRMHESLKKRRRREQLLKKNDGEPSGKIPESGSKTNENDASSSHQTRGIKRNLEEFLEESFINMKQKITDEIEKTKEDEENEKLPKTQDEVLGFMGLTRKDTLDVNLRKSKRERKGFKKYESMIGSNVNKEELYFLEKYWPEINVLFSTSLLIGAYSRTSTSRLREKCRMFHKLLSTWRGIVRDNPDWFGGLINPSENLVDDEDEPLNAESAKEKFNKMDIPALRTYIINCVKEVNKIKSRLRTKNTYFKVLYNKFVKPRMKKAKQTSEPSELQQTETYTTQKEDSEKTEDPKPTNSANTSTEVESSDKKGEDSQQSNSMSCISDGD